MKSKRFVIAIALTVLVTGLAASVRAEDVVAQDVFEQLTALAGTWQGQPEAHGEATVAEAERMDQAVHEFEVSAAGTVVMETMGPGTAHEMINMYHLDGEELVLTHYCAGGNQPKMQLNRQQSTSAKLVFDFAGGTNLDAAEDDHIHSAEISLVGSDQLKSVWNSYSGGEPAATMVFHLARGE